MTWPLCLAAKIDGEMWWLMRCEHVHFTLILGRHLEHKLALDEDWLTSVHFDSMPHQLHFEISSNLDEPFDYALLPAIVMSLQRGASRLG